MEDAAGGGCGALVGHMRRGGRAHNVARAGGCAHAAADPGSSGGGTRLEDCGKCAGSPKGLRNKPPLPASRPCAAQVLARRRNNSWQAEVVERRKEVSKYMQDPEYKKQVAGRKLGGSGTRGLSV